MLIQAHMLTTVDNPYDPITQFNEWDAWDKRAGYNTMSLLARIVQSSVELSEADQEFVIEEGILEIVEMNVTGMYRLVDVPASSDGV